MGIFDWFTKRGQNEPAVPGTIKKAKRDDPSKGLGDRRTPYTATPGVVVTAGLSQHGTYVLDPAITALGGKGVLDFIFQDDMLEEVMHNGSDRPLVVFHRSHGMCDVNYRLDPRLVEAFIQDIAERNGKELNDANPFLDGVLADGSRVNASIPPISGIFPNFTIRKFRKGTITVPDMIRFGAMTAEAAAFLWIAIEGLGRHAANVLVVGGTGSGKTTLLNALAWFAPQHHRIVVIEDTRELRIPHPNVLRMATSETIAMDNLLVNALRQRPDRILVGEVRSSEARTLFTAMNTGHDGCMGTLHANSARESMMRITSSPMSVPLNQLTALDLVVVQQRRTTEEGTRRFCSEITEISGFGGDTARLNQLYAWDEYKRGLMHTDVPSRLRTKLCQAAGITAEQFGDILTRRTQLLKVLAERRADEASVARALQEETNKPLFPEGR